MDKAKLASDYPALLAEIQKEAAAEAKAEAEKMMAGALENQLALARMVAGEEAAAKVAELSKAGLTAEQVAALGTAGFQPAQSGIAAEAKGRADILALLRESTPAPLPAGGQLQNPDPIAAAVERIAAVL